MNILQILKIFKLGRRDSKSDNANNYLTRNPPSSRTYSFLLKPSAVIFNTNFCNEGIILPAKGGCILMRIIPQYFSGGYMSIFEKCMSWVMRILSSLQACRATSWPARFRNDSTGERAIFFSFDKFRGKMKSCFNRTRCQGWVGLQNLVKGLACFKELQHKIYHNTGAFKAWLSVADVRVYNNIIFNFHNNIPPYVSITQLAKGVKKRVNSRSRAYFKN